MDREGRTATAGTPLAEQLGRVGLWTSKLDLQPADQLRSILTELEALGWGSLWSWEVFGREALTNAGLLLCTSQQLVIGTGIANIWARDPVAMAAAQRTLAEAYPGRFVLGLGVSHAPIVDARGHRYERPLERMRAYLDAMDAAPWQGPPLQEEPVRVLAALGPRMLELAAERSAGALTYNAAPEATAWARSILVAGRCWPLSRPWWWSRTRRRPAGSPASPRLLSDPAQLCAGLGAGGVQARGARRWG